MNSRGILDFRLVTDIASGDDMEKTLSTILETLECMQDNRTSVCYADELYDQFILGEEFSNWLYDLNSKPELSTLKKEFATRINRSSRISAEEYCELMDSVEQNICASELAMSVCCDTKNILYVGTPVRYWKAKQWYLSKYVKSQDFSSEIAECFPNLYFHENVGSSLHTLNAEFSIERSHIVHHLQALNDFKPRFLELRAEGADYRKICAVFQEEKGIECSPQADRKTARKLDYSFDVCTGERETVCCELHTKLKWRDMDREKQDRIYFHPGKPEIAGGNVLIAHIGEHQ